MKSNRVNIEKMVNGGYGLARLPNGQIILLLNSLQGETVEFRAIETRKKLVFGTTKEILTKNPGRISPPCPYYSNCGGCNLQHCNYEEQLAIKDAITKELFHDIIEDESLLKTVIPSPQQFSYRQRIRLKTAALKTGFYRFRSQQIVPVRCCLLAHPSINQVLEQILDDDSYHKLLHITEEMELHLNPNTSEISCLLHLRRKPRPADIQTANKLVVNTRKLERLFFIGQDFPLMGPLPQKENGGDRFFSQNIVIQTISSPVELTWEMGGFCQVNQEQNRELIQFVLKKCGSISSKSILDLFCGMGNFTIALAHFASSVYGIEGQGAAIRCAKMNSSTAQLQNTGFIKGDIKKETDNMVRKRQHFDIVLLDPPRAGVPALAKNLSLLTREKLIYISCDPATLVRDIGELCRQGFKLIEVQPFDMFPQTHHIETVAVLKRN